MRAALASLAASLAAGPLMLLIMVAPSLADGTGAGWDMESALNVILIATAIGAVLSLLPNLVGTLVLVRLSRSYPLARRVPVWAAAGGASAIPVAYWIRVGGRDPLILLPFALVGAVCATICRLLALPD